MADVDVRCECGNFVKMSGCCAETVAHELHAIQLREDARERELLRLNAAISDRERKEFARRYIPVNCPHCTGCGFRDIADGGRRRYHCGLVLEQDGSVAVPCANAAPPADPQTCSVPLSAVAAMISVPGLTMAMVRGLVRAMTEATGLQVEIVPEGPNGAKYTLRPVVK